MTIEIKDDGKAYVVKDCPNFQLYGRTQYDVEDYWDDLASCERILIEDQEKAKELLRRFAYVYDVRHIQPGLYQVPVEWEPLDVKVARVLSTGNKHKSMPLTGVVAILKDSPIKQQEDIDVTQLKEESQEDDLIAEIDDIVGGTYFHVMIYPESIILTEKRGSNNSVVKQFTRKP